MTRSRPLRNPVDFDRKMRSKSTGRKFLRQYDGMIRVRIIASYWLLAHLGKLELVMHNWCATLRPVKERTPGRKLNK
jgi:hypothetical protein